MAMRVKDELADQLEEVLAAELDDDAEPDDGGNKLDEEELFDKVFGGGFGGTNSSGEVALGVTFLVGGVQGDRLD